ncbi:CBS domain-containing protein [Gallaecimonas kandeliae]|uniref:CBS domain-containing protein n=1 Tax=Gallaecimonas kandeliae TaxID=3029055 RepID=UPI0026487D1F|nr:CBS domain-containing protein [Gallaecimonas kandeliae]WKE64811.1 CBS domain-containing protein [Gallaecimonas kandeliae]
MYVKDIMVTHAATCMPGTSLQDVAMQMWNHDCGAIVVVDAKEHPLGIVTDRDIAMGAALQHRPLWEMRAEEITNHRELYCCVPEDSIKHALKLMEKHEIRRLPVLDKDGRLCGILSMGDIVAFTNARAGKAAANQIAAAETLDYLRHVSSHHGHQVTVSH